MRRAAAHQPWNDPAWEPHLRDVLVRGRRVRLFDAGEGPPVLLVHGLGATWRTWYRNIPELVAAHRVIAVDLPGFGGSQVCRPAPGIGRYADVLAGVLDRTGVDRALTVGHSLGGLIAQRLAIGHPARVAALALVSSGGGTVAAPQAAAYRTLAAVSSAFRIARPPAAVTGLAFRALLAVGPVRSRLMTRGVHDPATVTPELVVDMLGGAFAAPGMTDAIRAGLNAGPGPDLSRIACPTLVLYGERDRLVPASVAEHLASSIPGARHERWTDVGHHPMLERPAAFNARLVEFFADVPRAA